MQEKVELNKYPDYVLADLVRGFCSSWKPTPRMDEQRLFAAISTIPEKKLSDVLRKALLASVPYTDEDVLLQASAEAGISMERDFVVDERYLQTKTR